MSDSGTADTQGRVAAVAAATKHAPDHAEAALSPGHGVGFNPQVAKARGRIPNSTHSATPG